mgnify:CR=1 FL=1
MQFVLENRNLQHVCMYEKRGKINYSCLQTIGAAFFLKQWGPYNIAIWVIIAITDKHS